MAKKQPNLSPTELTPLVLQAADVLGLYGAELARVLGLQCGDIGELASRQRLLQPGTNTWQQALDFVRLYRGMQTQMEGDEVAMYHWLRKQHPQLGETPLISIVDNGRLRQVLELLNAWENTAI